MHNNLFDMKSLSTTPKTLLCLVVLCLGIHHAFSQNWGKFFDKSRRSYEIGDYAKANKYIDKVIKKSKKKLGEENLILANALIQKAKFNIAYGAYNGVPTQIAAAVSMGQNLSVEDQSALAIMQLEAADAYIQYGHLVKAQEALDEAKSLFKDSGSFDEFTYLLSYHQSQILNGKGFYKQSIDLSSLQLSLLETELIAKSGSEKEEFLKVYGAFLIEKANAYRKMGDFLRSDSAFIANEQWMEQNLERGDLLIARNKYLNAKLLQENGLSVEAEADLFAKAYTEASRKHLPSHKQLIKINLDLMNAYYSTGQSGKLRILENEFKKLVQELPENSVYKYADQIREVRNYFKEENFRVIESRINGFLISESFPENHQSRINLYEFANQVALLYGQPKNTEVYQGKILAIKRELLGDNSTEYHLTNLKLANYYIDYADKFDEVKSIYENSFHEIVDPEIAEGHIMYLDIMDHLAKYYEETDQYDKASETLDHALLVARKKYDNKDVLYGKTLNKIAALQIKIGQYEKADDFLNQANEIFEEVDTDESTAYQAIVLINKAKLREIEGEYDEAETLIFESDDLKAKGSVTLETTGLDYRDDLASLYLQSGRLLEAEEIIALSLAEKQSEFGRESRHLNKALNLSSHLELLKGEYAEAEQKAKRALNISTGIFGDESTKAVPAMLSLASVYENIGDFEKAESLLSRAIIYQKREFGNKHVDVGKSISRLALVKFYQRAPLNEITQLFNDAVEIIGLKLGKENPTYAEVLKNLAVANIAAGEHEEAFTNLEKAGKIWNRKIGRRNNINASTVEVLKGDTYYKMGQFGRAENRYDEALSKFQKFFSDTHPEYVKVQSKLAKTYYMDGDWRKSLNEMDEVLLKYKDFLKQYFPALSEREKAKYWNTIKTDYEFYNTLIVSKNRNERYVGELFNNALLTKALLLNSSIKIRQRIMSSDDVELKNTYQEWITKKELLTAALSMTKEQLLSNNLDQGKLSSDVESLEKKLSVKSEIFGENYDDKQVTWENVREALDENEVAIEMVRFRVFEKEFTDSIKYALLYITGEKRSKPSMILLDNGEELENKYLKYYRNSIKFEIKDTKSYEAFWKPIVDEVGTVATLYISPDGVYNQINLEAIPTPEPNKYVIDNSNISLISNTKDLYLKKDAKEKPDTEGSLVATMFGDPVFYIQTDPGSPVKNSGVSRENATVINQLPGTRQEIEQVKGFLGRKGWDVKEFSDLDAREEIVKTIASPKIFHVATHGFFEEQATTATAVDQDLYQNYLYENPLLKSGLLLSGAGDILNTTKYNYNIESGILTAYEAMNLNLDQTELVVLSACETGLGELEAGEGVYGLQRSFLVAGAKAVVMSLFKVSDEVTQQLMVRFYQKWLASGDKRQAFIDAKKEIRNEYPDPKYWGPFVMIGSH
ncbi:MAG: CHAT domain-containing protein [Cyclobacteriaceae bacterium]